MRIGWQLYNLLILPLEGKFQIANWIDLLSGGRKPPEFVRCQRQHWDSGGLRPPLRIRIIASAATADLERSSIRVWPESPRVCPDFSWPGFHRFSWLRRRACGSRRRFAAFLAMLSASRSGFSDRAAADRPCESDRKYSCIRVRRRSEPAAGPVHNHSWPASASTFPCPFLPRLCEGPRERR